MAIARERKACLFQDSCFVSFSVSWIRKIAFWGLGLVICIDAGARVTQVDFSERNERLENKRFKTSTENPQANARWMDKRFSTKKFSTQEHRFSEKSVQFEKMDLFRSERYKTEELDFEVRDTVMFRGGDELFTSGNLERIRFNTLHHDVKKESGFADAERAVDIEEFLDRLSLADLNRYQFRRSHSSEPGIPVQQAAGGTAEE